MAASTVPDLTSIAAPIPGDNPAGVDFRADASSENDFRKVKETRNQARRLETRFANEQGDTSEIPNRVKPGDILKCWLTVRDEGYQLLAERSKDLEIAAYVIEAVVRTDGFAGLAQALTATRVLVDNFWEVLFPLPDEDGMETRTRPLAHLNGDGADGLLAAPLGEILITENTSAGGYAFWQYRQASDLAKCSDQERERRLERGAASPEKFRQAILDTSPQFFQDLIADIGKCQTEFQALCDALDQKCGSDANGHSLAPPSSSLKETFESCLTTVRHVAMDRLPTEAVEPNGTPVIGDNGLPKEPEQPGRAGGRLESRADAFLLLEQVAAFFESRDPRDLLAARIRHVVELGKMSREEYYWNLIENPAVRDEFFKTHGMKMPENGEKSD